uniref:H/ACA ribonucleoprotein complex subunit n=1 Tax=Strongyloides venezuelensis TaxID=75913 RepID=A0A0K0G1K6_STRVS
MSSSEKKRSEVKLKAMTIRELKEIRKNQKSSGIVIKQKDKHLTFKWNCVETLDKFVGKYKNSLLGKWISSLNGIVLGCVKTTIKKDCLIIEDQNCLHTDISFYFIIFSPKINRSYQCTVTKVEKKYVLGKLFDIIPCFVKNAPEDVSIGSVVTFSFVRAEFKGKLAMLSGNFDSLIDS